MTEVFSRQRGMIDLSRKDCIRGELLGLCYVALVKLPDAAMASATIRIIQYVGHVCGEAEAENLSRAEDLRAALCPLRIFRAPVVLGPEQFREPSQ